MCTAMRATASIDVSNVRVRDRATSRHEPSSSPSAFAETQDSNLCSYNGSCADYPAVQANLTTACWNNPVPPRWKEVQVIVEDRCANIVEYAKRAGAAAER